MPKYLDRATRTLVWQYGNETAIREGDLIGAMIRKDASPKTHAALEKLLDACVQAEANVQRGRTAMISVHWIRKQITEVLESDG